MKKFFSLFFVLIFICLCGCSNSETVVQTPEPSIIIEDSEVITDDSLLDSEAYSFNNQIIVSISSFTKQCKDPELGARTILDYYAENPSVYIENNIEAGNLINTRLHEINLKFYPDLAEGTDAISLDMDYFTYLQSLAEDNYMLFKESGADIDTSISFIRMVKPFMVNENTICFDFINYEDDFSEEKYYFRLDDGEEVFDNDISAVSDLSKDCNGSLNLSKLSDNSSESDFPIVDCVAIDDEGQDYLVNVSGDIINICITEIKYIDGKFFDYSDLWFCNYLSDCSIQIKSVLHEEPHLKLSYSTSSGTNNYILVLDDADNPMLMLEDAWNALG